jgi:hypothetical protein
LAQDPGGTADTARWRIIASSSIRPALVQVADIGREEFEEAHADALAGRRRRGAGLLVTWSGRAGSRRMLLGLPPFCNSKFKEAVSFGLKKFFDIREKLFEILRFRRDFANGTVVL